MRMNTENWISFDLTNYNICLVSYKSLQIYSTIKLELCEFYLSFQAMRRALRLMWLWRMTAIFLSSITSAILALTRIFSSSAMTSPQLSSQFPSISTMVSWLLQEMLVYCSLSPIRPLFSKLCVWVQSSSVVISQMHAYCWMKAIIFSMFLNGFYNQKFLFLF